MKFRVRQEWEPSQISTLYPEREMVLRKLLCELPA